MTHTSQKRIKELLDRLGRIAAAGEWDGDLNPTQLTALSYLARANRFSRTPTQVSEFMAATRGTVSQTLKALARKGFICEHRSERDKRSISYSLTDTGRALLTRVSGIEDAVSSLNDEESSSLLAGLEALARGALRQRGFMGVGVA